MEVRKFFTFYLVLASSFYCQKQTGMARLEFIILDKDSGKPIPAKLVFTKGKDDSIQLHLPETFGLASEGNGFYTAFGKGEVNIPAGKYTIYASRGMEYSVDKKTVHFKKDQIVEQTWTIKRELDPKGYVCSDLHMHTTNSDGHCSEEERVTSLVGEGVEFAAASDHNFVTDFGPAANRLGVTQYISTCSSNELTTNIGHFNIYPLPPHTLAFDHRPKDANILFAYRDNLPGPVINQVNHPRWEGLDYFGQLKLDPVTGEISNPLFSHNFQAMEIMNETIGWGLQTCDENKISVWDEWFNFLNKDFRVTGMGNCDCHVLLSMPVGWPRNYIASSTDDPAGLNPYALAQSILDHKVSVARGVFVNLIANETWPIGSDVVDTDGTVDFQIEVMAPSWVKVDKLTLYGNAREIWSREINPTKESLHFKTELKVDPKIDTWYVLKAEGSQSLWPIIPDQYGLSVTPVGFTNPIWVDIDGNGFETERDRAVQFVHKYGNDANAFRTAIQNTDWWSQRQVLALLVKDSELESVMIELFLSSDQQVGRKFAYARIGEKANADDIHLLQSAKSNLKDEPERVLVDTYIAKLGPKSELLDFMNTTVINSKPALRSEQCQILSMNQFPKQWLVVGPFVNEGETGLNVSFTPEEKIDINDSYTGKGNRDIKWQKVIAENKGYVNLKQITDDPNHSLAYAHVMVRSSKTFQTALFFGSDDGAAIWLNGKEVFRKLIRRGANPYQEFIPLTLAEGENHFLVKVENGSGDWDFYFEIFDPLEELTL